MVTSAERGSRRRGGAIFAWVRQAGVVPYSRAVRRSNNEPSLRQLTLMDRFPVSEAVIVRAGGRGFRSPVARVF
jgi:hypothetical protein